MEEEVLTEIECWFGREVVALPPGLRGRRARAGDALGRRQTSFRRGHRSDGCRGSDGRR